MRYLVLAAMMALTSCSSLDMFVEADLTNAAQVATLNGDAIGAECATALAKAVQPTEIPANDGLFTLGERKRVIKMVLISPSCAPITVTIIQDAVKTVPFFGNVVGGLGL